MDYTAMDMQSLAATLGQLYSQQAEAGLREWQTERDIERRRFETAPADLKSLGANEAERKAALERLYAADAILNQMVADHESAHYEGERLKAQIAAAEAARRACEWYIRAELAQVVNRADRSGYEPASDQVLDTASQNDIDHILESQAQAVEDDLPF